MSERAISRVLSDLASAGYEMREQVDTDKRGRPVFAYPGRRMRFRVPLLPPRMPAGSGDHKHARSGDPKPARSGDHKRATRARSPDLVVA